VKGMQPGSVIVDMAAETGGNAAGTKAGETVVTDNGVKIIGPVNLPSEMAPDASALYAKNLSNLMELITDEGKLNLNFEDEVVKGACLTHDGEIVNERAKEAAS
jgi:H+-translocating NAD(P) transhydrogenase subunit alpha